MSNLTVSEVTASEMITATSDVMLLRADSPTVVKTVLPPANASAADCVRDCHTVHLTILLSDKVTIAGGGNIETPLDGYDLQGHP